MAYRWVACIILARLQMPLPRKCFNHSFTLPLHTGSMIKDNKSLLGYSDTSKRDKGLTEETSNSLSHSKALNPGIVRVCVCTCGKTEVGKGKKCFCVLVINAILQVLAANVMLAKAGRPH